MPRREWKKTRKIHGGKHIFSGAYGCGFSPALRCEGNADREPGIFSKLMNRREAAKEFRKRNLYEPINAEQKYFLYPLKTCKPDFKRLDPVENNIQVCEEHIENMEKNAQILQFRDGGENLLKLKLTPEEIAPFFRDFTKVFEAIALLQDKKIVHSDIKQANVVYKRKEGGGFDFYVIDFGLSAALGKIPYDFPTDANYAPWPYEIKFAFPHFIPDNDSFKEFTDMINEYLDDRKILGTNIQSYNYEDLKSIFTILKNLTPNSRMEISHLKLDVYSLGLLLLELFTAHTKFVLRNGILYKMAADGSFGNPLLYMELEAYKNIERHVVRPFYELIRKMMNLHSGKRLFAQQALSEYKKIVPQMEKYLTAETLKQIGGKRSRAKTRKVAH
jgi:serine/threonine protein kinase